MRCMRSLTAVELGKEDSGKRSYSRMKQWKRLLAQIDKVWNKKSTVIVSLCREEVALKRADRSAEADR
ncbi:MAG: hypothetical protein ACLR2O_01290 [Coprococcus sp.]